MAQSWNSSLLPWQNTAITWKQRVSAMPWNDITLPWKNDPDGGPVNTIAPAVTGTATTGQTLTTTNGTWLNSPTSYSYQWYWLTTSGGLPVTDANGNYVGQLITGATSSTYTIVSGDVAQQLFCDVTATNVGGSAVKSSNYTSAIPSAGWTFVASASVAGANGGTTAAKDTTGSTLIVIATERFASGPAITVTDSKSNTWTPLTASIGGPGSVISQFFYCANPVVGAGHTFTIAGASSFSALAAIALSGGANATPFDVENSNVGTAATGTSGSVIPGSNNELVCVCVGTSSSTINSIDGGFVIDETINFSGGNNFGISVAHLIQTTAAAANPTWTFGASLNYSGTSASFKVS